ncbi:uncharacterized protein LOC142576151 [Dermacentor variabilis]|uniref:uncharacterized protein LOC142576151 n=1 Tax=Dermacentor variabilis TaxID=34621 RepID=UPI003F5C0367
MLNVLCDDRPVSTSSIVWRLLAEVSTGAPPGRAPRPPSLARPPAVRKPTRGALTGNWVVFAPRVAPRDRSASRLARGAHPSFRYLWRGRPRECSKKRHPRRRRRRRCSGCCRFSRCNASLFFNVVAHPAVGAEFRCCAHHVRAGAEGGASAARRCFGDMPGPTRTPSATRFFEARAGCGVREKATWQLLEPSAKRSRGTRCTGLFEVLGYCNPFETSCDGGRAVMIDL